MIVMNMDKTTLQLLKYLLCCSQRLHFLHFYFLMILKQNFKYLVIVFNHPNLAGSDSVSSLCLIGTLQKSAKEQTVLFFFYQQNSFSV